MKNLTGWDGGGWTCALCGEWVRNDATGPGHNCVRAFKKCPACGLEWRGAAVLGGPEGCPGCYAKRGWGAREAHFNYAGTVTAERDQARDWCRKLVRLFRETQALMDEIQEQRIGASNQHSGIDDVYRALPPELRDAIEEAK